VTIRTRTAGNLLVATAAMTLAASFLAICRETGTLWPWNRVVHEEGSRTLRGTLLYWEHATRELLTHALVTVPLGVAAALPSAPDMVQQRPEESRGSAAARAMLELRLR